MTFNLKAFGITIAGLWLISQDANADGDCGTNLNVRVQSDSGSSEVFDIEVSGNGHLRRVYNRDNGIVITDKSDEVISNYSSAEFDLIFLAGNFQYSRNVTPMTVQLNLSEQNVPGGPCLLSNADGGVLRGQFPDIHVTMTSLPNIQTIKSYDYGPSINPTFGLTAMSIQGFFGTEITGEVTSGFNVSMSRRIKVQELIEEIKPDLPPQSKMYLELVEFEKKVREQQLSDVDYLNLASFLILPVVVGLDKSVAMWLGTNSDYMKKSVTNPKPEDDWIVRGEALNEAVGEVMRTFLCRFPPVVLQQNTNHYLVRRYIRSCQYLRRAAEKDGPYAFKPETVSAERMTELLESGNDGASLFYLMAEAHRGGFGFFSPDGERTSHPWTTSDAGKPDRRRTLKFVNRLATNPNTAKLALQSGGLLLPSELADWEAGNMGSVRLREILERFDGHTLDSPPLRNEQNQRTKDWYQWIDPYPNAQYSMRAELAHLGHLPNSFAYRWHREEEMPDTIHNLYEEKIKYRGIPFKQAINYCLKYGMAVMGYDANGWRGVNQLQELKERNTTDRLHNPMGFMFEYPKACYGMWGEPPVSEKWEDNRYLHMTHDPSDGSRTTMRWLHTPKFHGEISSRVGWWQMKNDSMEDAELVCVSGTATPRSPQIGSGSR